MLILAPRDDRATMPQCDLRERIFYCEIRESASEELINLTAKLSRFLKYYFYFQLKKFNVVD
ncbi:hypothetical protein BS636_09815 [Acinetobacter sp. LoGeW2-3]|nr:hypothetical protein BS636_09815 [Acinetobacter sp. LoGeW2-3]